MKRLSVWLVFGALLLTGAGAGCGGSDETPKDTKFVPQQETKHERKPKQAMGIEPLEKIPPMPGRGK